MGCYISLKVFFDAPVQNSASKLLFFGETNYSPKYFVRWWFLKDFRSELCGLFEAPGSCCCCFPPRENSKQSAKMHIPPQHTETSTFFLQPTPSWAEQKKCCLKNLPSQGLAKEKKDPESWYNHHHQVVDSQVPFVFRCVLPSSKLTWQAGKSPFLVGDTSSTGPFSSQPC